ncbi:MAG: 50S ribosomal protein L35ae [Desulfurococcales archaeon ex4484_217_2]|nr:MAG: 50S ribosomal protein L35ae [Desulfurococcales archaeon ex4484_217_2]
MTMDGTITNFKLGNRYDGRKVILKIQNIKSYREAAQLIGRKVIWVHPKKNTFIKGKIIRVHGKRGRVLAFFRKALPGFAVGSRVQIL